MKEVAHPRGRIVTEYWVSCGRCFEHEPLVDVRLYGTPNKNAKAIGWRYTKQFGYLCPRCWQAGEQ